MKGVLAYLAATAVLTMPLLVRRIQPSPTGSAVIACGGGGSGGPGIPGCEPGRGSCGRG
jgi:hypothetical protein